MFRDISPGCAASRRPWAALWHPFGVQDRMSTPKGCHSAAQGREAHPGNRSRAILLSLAALVFGTSLAHAQWQRQEIATDADFRGLSVVSAKVAWVSGTKGTFARTADGGRTWNVRQMPGAEKL